MQNALCRFRVQFCARSTGHCDTTGFAQMLVLPVTSARFHSILSLRFDQTNDLPNFHRHSRINVWLLNPGYRVAIRRSRRNRETNRTVNSGKLQGFVHSTWRRVSLLWRNPHTELRGTPQLSMTHMSREITHFPSRNGPRLITCDAGPRQKRSQEQRIIRDRQRPIPGRIRPRSLPGAPGRNGSRNRKLLILESRFPAGLAPNARSRPVTQLTTRLRAFFRFGGSTPPDSHSDAPVYSLFHGSLTDVVFERLAITPTALKPTAWGQRSATPGWKTTEIRTLKAFHKPIRL
jgi:hypothetical protein